MDALRTAVADKRQKLSIKAHHPPAAAAETNKPG
jgi:hypothetical protein